jgi:hypothetical protein
MSMVQLVGLQYTIDETKESLAEKKKSLEESIALELESLKLKQSIELKMKNIKKLKQELEESKEKYEERKQNFQRFNKLTEIKIQKLIDSEGELLSQSEFLTENFNLKKYKNDLKEIQKKLSLRRKVIIDEIFEIYSIQKTETTLTISNISITKNKF